MVTIEIKKILLDEGLSIQELAERCGWKNTTLYAKFRRDNFTVQEMDAIAKALDRRLEIAFAKG